MHKVATDDAQKSSLKEANIGKISPLRRLFVDCWSALYQRTTETVNIVVFLLSMSVI